MNENTNVKCKRIAEKRFLWPSTQSLHSCYLTEDYFECAHVVSRDWRIIGKVQQAMKTFLFPLPRTNLPNILSFFILSSLFAFCMHNLVSVSPCSFVSWHLLSFQSARAVSCYCILSNKREMLQNSSNDRQMKRRQEKVKTTVFQIVLSSGFVTLYWRGQNKRAELLMSCLSSQWN